MDQIIGKSIVRIPMTDSTNNYAKQQIRQDDFTEGTVFLTYEQTDGRGQLNNMWESEVGKNLSFSIVLYPVFLEINRQFLLSKVITLGIYNALVKYVDRLKIKWPNDIYAGDRKLGGILIENSLMYGLLKNSVAGIGLNVNQTVFKSNAPNPVSLQILTNQHYDCEQILSEVLLSIDRYYSILRMGGKEQINREFVSVLYRLNEKSDFRAGNLIFKGEILGVNEIGQLMIKKEDGEIRHFHFKEVEFLHGLK